MIQVNRYRPAQIFHFFLYELWLIMFQGTDPFHLGYQICIHRIFHTSYFILLFVSKRFLVMPSVSFVILVICIFFYSLSWQRPFNFIDLYKEPTSGFIDFSLFISCFNFIDFCSNSFFFTSTQFGFNFLFLVENKDYWFYILLFYCYHSIVNFPVNTVFTTSCNF